MRGVFFFFFPQRRQDPPEEGRSRTFLFGPRIFEDRHLLLGLGRDISADAVASRDIPESESRPGLRRGWGGNVISGYPLPLMFKDPTVRLRLTVFLLRWRSPVAEVGGDDRRFPCWPGQHSNSEVEWSGCSIRPLGFFVPGRLCILSGSASLGVDYSGCCCCGRAHKVRDRGEHRPDAAAPISIRRVSFPATYFTVGLFYTAASLPVNTRRGRISPFLGADRLRCAITIVPRRGISELCYCGHLRGL